MWPWFWWFLASLFWFSLEAFPLFGNYFFSSFNWKYTTYLLLNLLKIATYRPLIRCQWSSVEQLDALVMCISRWFDEFNFLCIFLFFDIFSVSLIMLDYFFKNSNMKEEMRNVEFSLKFKELFFKWHLEF